MLTCEDKFERVSSAVVQDDPEKGNTLREKRLLYLQSNSPYKSNVKHIKVLSAQFHGRTLTIYGSKMTEVGDIIHYQKARATIPAFPFDHLPQAAHYPLTVLSSQPLPIGVINNNLFFRQDLHGSECSYQSNNSDELDLEEGQEHRITESIDHEIEKLDNGESVLTANDWESFTTR